MRILYVHAKGELGGSDISLLTILKNVDRKKFSPNVIVAKKGPLFNDYKKYCNRCEEVKFSVLKSPDNLIGFLKMLFGLVPSIFLIWRIIKNWKIDLVHVNTIVIPSAIIATKLAKKPIIVHKREIIVSNKLAAIFLDLFASLFADKIIAISNAVKNRSLKSVQKKTVVIYNGVDVSEIPSERSNKLRNVYKINNNELLIGVFSRIEPWKGQHIVIEALPNVISKVKNVRVLIFGQPYTEKGKKYFENLKNLVKRLNLDDKVSFPGIAKNLNEIYNEFDLIILPSIDPEPLGRVIIEAMTAKRAVIATNTGGSKEIIKNGETGVLVEPKNVTAMSKAIVDVLKYKSFREKIGNNAWKDAIKRFNMKALIKIVENLYKTLS